MSIEEQRARSPIPQPATTQPTEAQPDQKEPKRSPEHTVLLLTLVPLGLVALRILIVSRGDSDTLRALVQNLNVTAIVLATILPFVTTGVVLLFVMALLSGLNQYRARNEPPKPGKKQGNGVATVIGTIVFLGPLTAAPCWFAMPMKYAIFAGIISGLLLLVYFGSLHSDKFKPQFQAFSSLYLILLLVGGLYVVIAQVGVWLPRERLTIGGRQSGVVYILSSDEQWTKYLDDQTHKVHVVPTENVKHRELITDRDGWQNQTASQVWERPGAG